jgi:hypothetical protein
MLFRTAVGKNDQMWVGTWLTSCNVFQGGGASPLLSSCPSFSPLFEGRRDAGGGADPAIGYGAVLAIALGAALCGAVVVCFHMRCVRAPTHPTKGYATLSADADECAA